jgi:protein-S-isoprenylcysteine O-methyltransferase Ste14
VRGEDVHSARLFHHHPVMIAIWVATYALWIAPEIVLGFRRPAMDARREDRGSMLVVVGSIYLGIALAFLAVTVATRFTVGAQWKTMFFLGLAVWYGGMMLRWYSIRVLGRFFTTQVAIAKDQHVVELGPYRWLRHPSYLGSLLAVFGFGMTLTNWLSAVLPVVCLLAAYAYRIPLEERALERGLGPAYSEYMRRTWRLVLTCIEFGPHGRPSSQSLLEAAICSGKQRGRAPHIPQVKPIQL